MTPTEYRNSGFEVSAHIEQPILDRCEATVYDAYIKPICPNADKTTKQIKTAIMLLSYIMLLTQNAKATCSGAKVKNDTTTSQSVDYRRVIIETGKQAAMLIETLKQRPDAIKGAEIYDVLGLFFKSNYFNI